MLIAHSNGLPGQGNINENRKNSKNRSRFHDELYKREYQTTPLMFTEVDKNNPLICTDAVWLSVTHGLFYSNL